MLYVDEASHYDGMDVDRMHRAPIPRLGDKKRFNSSTAARLGDKKRFNSSSAAPEPLISPQRQRCGTP